MNAPHKVVAVRAHVPAIVDSAKRWKKLDTLATDADYLVGRFDDIYRARMAVHRRDVEYLAKRLSDAELDGDDRETIADCLATLALLDPSDCYDDDGELKKDRISIRLAGLVGAFPAGTPGSPETYVKMLLEHVAAIGKLSYLALDDGCREIEATKKFLPAASEVLEAVEGKIELWAQRRSAINKIESEANEFARDYAERRPQLNTMAAKRTLQKAEGELNGARWRLKSASDDLTKKQMEAARLAKDIESGFMRLAQCEAAVAEKERALTEAKREADTAASAAETPG